MGRSHIYHLDSFLWFLVLKKIFGFSQTTQMINVLKCSCEFRNLCGFSKVPDNSQISRFLHNFSSYILADKLHKPQFVKSIRNWGANHGVISYGHIGADIITLCSMLRIPVCMHNVDEKDIYRPASWNAFGMDKEGQDYRACQTYGPMYKNIK